MVLSPWLVDPLTNISNRRAFDFQLTRKMIEWQRQRAPVALFMIDIDFFKKINDTHGHQAGDAVLVQVASIIKNTMREMDLVSRFGGEEFAVILPNTSADIATNIATRIIQSVQQMKLPHAASEISEWVTISLGITQVIPTQEITPEFLIYRADRALYQAKQQGRNRYCLLS